MDKDDAARRQSALQLRGREQVGYILQITPVAASTVALGEQGEPLPVDLRHNYERECYMRFMRTEQQCCKSSKNIIPCSRSVASHAGREGTVCGI
jgi:hypothetical protein